MALNNRSTKWLLFGLVVTLFSLTLAFAAFVFLLIEVAGTAINAARPIGQGINIIVFVAIFIGLLGLAIAYVGAASND